MCFTFSIVQITLNEEMTISIILFAIASYLLGAVPTGLILARVFSYTDIRRAGSGNIGATNVTRLLGKKLGALTFLGDGLKGFMPVFIGAQIFTTSHVPVCLFGLAAFLGHLFPLYLRFKGGKGVATAFGVFLYLSPVVILIEFLLFAGIVAVWRFVSLASLIVTAAMPVLLALFSFPFSVIILSIIMGLLIFIKHKPNIQRLVEGTEHKTGAST